jgi:hypothetical protein
MKNEKVIDEKALCSLIKTSSRHIVNILEDKFQYCNGYVFVVCSYENHEVIQRLFKVGALNNYRNITSSCTHDFSDITKCSDETEAIRTSFLKAFKDKFREKYTACVFKINGNYYLFDEKFVNVFKNVQFKSSSSDKHTIPLLRAYDGDNLVGVIMPIRYTGEEPMNEILESIEQKYAE